jgi:hypothetical protein
VGHGISGGSSGCGDVVAVRTGQDEVCLQGGMRHGPPELRGGVLGGAPGAPAHPVPRDLPPLPHRPHLHRRRKGSDEREYHIFFFLPQIFSSTSNVHSKPRKSHFPHHFHFKPTKAVLFRTHPRYLFELLYFSIHFIFLRPITGNTLLHTYRKSMKKSTMS